MPNEDSTRQLIRTLRKRTKFEGSDLALLHQQQNQLSSAVSVLLLLAFLSGTFVIHAGGDRTIIIAVLCYLGFTAFFAYRLMVYSSAVSFLISHKVFDLP